MVGPPELPETGTLPYRCARYSIVLPETIRYGQNEWVIGPTDPYPDGDYWVALLFTQLGRSASAGAVASTLLDHVGSDVASADNAAITEFTTIVDAITPDLAFGREPEGFSQPAPQDRLPSQVPLNRCIDSIDRICRAYRIAASVPLGRITYERLFPLVAAWRSAQDATVEALFGFETRAWGEPSLMRLDHYNVTQPVGPAIDDELSFRMMDLAHAQVRRYPFFVWRERMLEAERAFYLDGSFTTTVVLAQTAAEVFLDGLLSLLLWEENVTPQDAAAFFTTGTAVSRTNRMYHNRLGGRWSTLGVGAIATWYRDTAMLRHRVVHTGFEPSRTQARNALDAARKLQNFAFDRLIDRRNRYKRTTLMTVGVEGLQARDLWRGAIAKFFRDEGPNEPDWRDAFASWQAALADLSLMSGPSTETDS